MGLNRQGKRIERKKALKDAKFHKKEFYAKLDELEYISNLLQLEGVVLTEDNIVKEVAKVSSLTLGAMEKMILINKQSELNEKIHVGNLRWEGEPFDSNVVWKPNPRGNIRTTWIPDKELQNLSSVKLFHGKKLRMPDNNHIGALGVDSYDISKTVDGKGSNGAVVGKTKTNFAGAPSNSFFLVYTDRPDKRNDFYDDVIKMCQFFGMYALVENNKPRLLEYMAEKGYRGYSLTRPDKKWSELSPFEKDFGGIPASTQTNKDVASLLKDFITDYIGQGLPHECTCYFGDMVEEWKNFDVNKRKEFDMSVASQLALMACQYKVKQRKTLNIGENDPDKQFSFSSFSA